jgi:hypothetical protein
MSARRYPWSVGVGLVIALVAISACSGAPAVTSAPASTGSAPTSGPGGTTAPAATPAPTVAPAPTAAPTKALPAVDLVLSGGIAVTAKGTKGQCTLGKDAAGKVIIFGFNAVEADYPGLGGGLYINEGNNGFVTTKWIPDASTGFINGPDQKGVSADHHSITIDIDLGGGKAKEHLKGTITCP